MVKRRNDICRFQMPNITPRVCRHTCCSNQTGAGMNPKTLRYLMGRSDICVTHNTYLHPRPSGAPSFIVEMIRCDGV